MWAFRGDGDLALRRVVAAMALAAVAAFPAASCGGTLEGKYRRGELTTTTTGGARSTGTTPATVATTTTTTTTPSSGNAAGQGAQGEPERRETDGTIVGSAAWRTVASPLGGRHR
jgi:hypothetical protein